MGARLPGIAPRFRFIDESDKSVDRNDGDIIAPK